MKKAKLIINGCEIGDLVGFTEIKHGTCGGYTGAFCDSDSPVAITAKDKNGTKWKFKIKRQTFEKLKTSGELFKYIEKLKNQRLRRIARKTGDIIIKL